MKVWLKFVLPVSHTLLNARLHDLHKHMQTHKHINSSIPFSSTRQQILPFKPATLITNHQRKEAQLCLYAAVHTSINSIDHLSDMHKDLLDGGISVHRTKCTYIINNVIGPHFKNILIKDINNSPFSLIIDESTDISVLKMLGIVVRYNSASLGKTVSTYLALINIENGTADCIVEAIKKLLQDYNLNIKNLQGLGTDNASTMVGINNGVFVKLKEDVPHLILVRCICHSLQLALSKATENTLPRNIDFIIKETYSWFAFSSGRQLTYLNIYKTLNDGEKPLKFLRMSDTRWISIEPAVKRILDQWNTLKDHFKLVRCNDYSAELLYSMYSDPNNFIYLSFLYPILNMVQKTNKNFESAVADPTKLLTDLKNLYSSILNMILNPTARIDIYDMNTNFENYLDPSPYIGYAFENSCRIHNISSDEKCGLKKRCVSFLINLAKELKNRLPNNLKILANISSFSVDEALKPTKLPITDLILKFADNVNKINAIEIQWANIHTIKWIETKNTENFWHEVFKYRDASGDNPFHELCNLAFRILCLPHSNADVERIFSQMNLIKNKIRNRMTLNLLNNILHIRFNLKRLEKCCKDYTLPDDVLKVIGTMKTYDNDISVYDTLKEII